MNQTLQFFKHMLSVQYVKRYHTIDTVRTQNVAEHSFNVAWLAWTTAIWAQSRVVERVRPYHVLLQALVHDYTEVYMGDTPLPIKQRLGQSWQQMEDKLRTDFLQQLPEEIRTFLCAPLSELENKIVCSADYLECCHFLLQEAHRGNRRGIELFNNGWKTLAQYDDEMFHEMDCPIAIFKGHLQVLYREYSRNKHLEEEPLWGKLT